MADDDRLALSITGAGGRVSRWGADEVAPENVPSGLTFSSSMPGGFKDMTCNLLRRITRDYSDQNLFDRVRLYSPGGQTVWAGRMHQFPRAHTDQFSVVPSAVGMAAHLKDDDSFREIYVDRDLGAWIPASVQRRLYATASWSIGDAQVVPDSSTGQAALQLKATDPWGAAPGTPLIEAYYDAGGGLAIGSIYYSWKRNGNVNPADINWSWNVYLSNDDVYPNQDVSGNLRAAGPGAGGLTATTAKRRFAVVQLYYPVAVAGQNNDYSLYWTCLAVYGNHGLPTYQLAEFPNAYGVHASDVIANIVKRAAPLLNYTTGPAGSIQPTSFVIPHLTFKDPGTAEAAILATNAFHLWDWGVYSGGYDGYPEDTFFFRPPDPTRLIWEARLSEGAELSLEGDQADDVYNGVFVTYTQPDGTKHTVGPPGAAAEATNASLGDASPTNPVNAHGIPRKWGRLDLSIPTTVQGATQIGAVWLVEHSLSSRRGTLEVTGRIKHPTAGSRPVFEVRAGDYVRIADHPADVPRRIIESHYTHDSRALSLSLDSSSHKLDAVLSRMGVALTGVI